MEKRNAFTKILAIVGTVLVWAPILFMVVTSVIGSIASGIFRCDYLIPLELFPAVIVGVALLLWAAIRAKFCIKAVAWGLGLIVFFLVCSTGIAQVTGLASGARQPEGWPWALVIGSLVLYSLAVVWLGITGITLIKRLYQIKQE